MVAIGRALMSQPALLLLTSRRSLSPRSPRAVRSWGVARDGEVSILMVSRMPAGRSRWRTAPICSRSAASSAKKPMALRAARWRALIWGCEVPKVGE
jgi:hypothetical protein